MNRVLIVGNGGSIFSSLLQSAPTNVEVWTAGRRAADFALTIETQELELPSSGFDSVIHLAWDSQRLVRRGQYLSYRLAKTVASWHQSTYTRAFPRFIFLSSCAAHQKSWSDYGQFKYLTESFLDSMPGCHSIRPGLVVSDDTRKRVQSFSRFHRPGFPVTYAQPLAQRVWDVAVGADSSTPGSSESFVNGYLGPVGLAWALAQSKRAVSTSRQPPHLARYIDRLLVLTDTVTRKE